MTKQEINELKNRIHVLEYENSGLKSDIQLLNNGWTAEEHDKEVARLIKEDEMCTDLLDEAIKKKDEVCAVLLDEVKQLQKAYVVIYKANADLKEINKTLMKN